MLIKNLLLADLLATTVSASTIEATKADIEARRAPICYKDQSVMQHKHVANGSRYSRTEPCSHHTFGTDRVWYQDYLDYYECLTCGLRTGQTTSTVYLETESFGHDY